MVWRLLNPTSLLVGVGFIDELGGIIGFDFSAGTLSSTFSIEFFRLSLGERDLERSMAGMDFDMST